MDSKEFNWKRLVITTLLVVFAAGTVGGTTWYVMNYQSNNEKAEFEKQIGSLEAQVKEFSKKVDTKEEVKKENVLERPSVSPTTVVTEMVAKYLKNTGGNYSSYYTSNFQNKKPEGISPIVYAQDTPTKYPVTYEYITADNKEAHVIVYYNYGEESPSTWNVLFILKNEGGKWLIDSTDDLRR